LPTQKVITGPKKEIIDLIGLSEPGDVRAMKRACPTLKAGDLKELLNVSLSDEYV
jgi:hypothetical protein